MKFFSLFEKQPKIQKKSVFLILLVSIGIGTGAPLGAFYAWKFIERYRRKDSAFNIRSVYQRSSGQDQLPMPYLEQMLGLCVDLPENLYAFDANAARLQLLRYGIFKRIVIKKVKPHSLLIDYTLRKPIGMLSNFENTAIDEEGILFPFNPFYSPKELPEVIFGEELFSDLVPEAECLWGRSIPKKRMELLLSLFAALPDSCKKIDLAKIDAPSYGQREIVVCLSDQTLLRLSTKNFEEELINFALLADEKALFFEKKSVIVDLRIPEVAYIMSAK